MSNKVAYVSDFFIDQLKGGAEFVDDTIINYLSKKINLTKINTQNLNTELIDTFDFFIISNISLAPSNIVEYLSTKKYIIIEHDYKFIQSRWIPIYDLISKEPKLSYYIKLYKNAIKTFVQTDYHKKVFEQNSIQSTFHSLKCSIWSDDELDNLRTIYKNRIKNKQFCIIDSDSIIKGKKQAIDFCKLNEIEYDLIKNSDHKQFLKTLSEYENLIFFPVLAETCSRLAVEARCLGCNVISHFHYGATSSDWFDLSGEELIDYLKIKSNNNLESIFHSLN